MILICEPQCAGFEHVEVNSALIAVIANAFPQEEIFFLAEEEHCNYIEKKLKNKSLKFVKFIKITIPPRNYSSWKRVPWEFQLAREIFQLANQFGANKVLFSSMTTPGLHTIRLMQKHFKNIKCLIIPHGILETVITPPSLFSLRRIFWLGYALKCNNDNRIGYLVLGPSIEEQLIDLIPELQECVFSIDHPYFFKAYRPEFRTEKSNQKIIRFGTLGIAHRKKGSHLLFKLADKVQTIYDFHEPKFYIIGPMVDPKLKKMHSDKVVICSKEKPLERNDFDNYVSMIDYAVFFYGPDSYRLTASGAMFDAFSHVKPIIALRNPYFEHYFKRFGDIGYLCETYEEIEQVVQQIISSKSVERYNSQIENLILARKQLSISRIGEKFKHIWNSF